MTLMKSEPGRSGEVTHTHLVKMEIKAQNSPDQLGIISPDQVTEWIRNLEVGASDTVLIYFNGHGKMDRYGTHQLYFDKSKWLVRDVVLKALREKSCRLKLLITDTYSETMRGTHPAGGADLAQYGNSEAKPQFYARNLFLEHTGILDITAASPEIRTAIDTDKAYADAVRGGFFTYALTNALVPTADINGDDFLSWEEVFAAIEAKTKQLYEKQPVLKAQNIIQQPVAHTPFPTRISGGEGSGASIHPDTTASVVHLNFTSVSSGARVSIDGAVISIDGAVVGKTPLMNYEVEIDGSNTKEIEVAIKATGYEEDVKTFRVRRGKPFNWEFELRKKVPEIPESFIGQDGAEMVLIDAGKFRTVYVDAFYMDKYEVTNAEYAAFLNAKGKHAEAGKAWYRIGHPSSRIEYVSRKYQVKGGYENHPVTLVSWYGAMAYAAWQGKRLPTEVEWEKAARGGLLGLKYPWGNAIDSKHANYNNYVKDTTVVGKYAPNGYGLYDMAGNVSEWCLDEYNPPDFYNERPIRAISPSQNPLIGRVVLDDYTGVKTIRVLRGGSWSDHATLVRVTLRLFGTPTAASSDIGFRCVRAVE